MRLLICEYVTGGGFLGSPLPPGLALEGDMMLAALVKDIAALGDIDIASVRDGRLPRVNLPASFHILGASDEPWANWREAMVAADAVWPIAPETGGVLTRLSELVLAAGRVLVGSRPQAVALATSKLATAECLSASGVAVVPTLRIDVALRHGLSDGTDGWIVKPDDGAGSGSTYLFRRADDLRRWLAGASDRAGFVVQPFVPGAAGSLSILCRDGRARLLSCNRQEIVIAGGQVHFRGSKVGGMERLRPAGERIAGAVAAAMPGLWGYVGIDFVDSAAGPVVLEVNPRLTTSYVGLGSSIGLNPAGLVLDLIERDLDEIERSPRFMPRPIDVVAVHA